MPSPPGPTRVKDLGDAVPENERHARTVARIKRIQAHLTITPRTERLKGLVCIVTGAGSLKGIGRATALLFAHNGARHIYVLDFAGENLPELKATIERTYPGVRATVVQGDAADDATISGLCARALKEEGRLDIFFANAGITRGSFLTDITPEEYTRTMHVNSLSCFLAVKHGSEAMRKAGGGGKTEPGGSIIMTASVAGVLAGAGPVDYSASKASVISIAQTAACQLARTGVRVNSVSPGLIETGMTEIVFDAARARGNEAKIGQLCPLGRYGVPEEIAQVVLFLASDDSSYINGQNIPVDGGLTASMPVVPGKFH